MTSYHQIIDQERGIITRELRAGSSLRSIGRLLGRNHSTLSRELTRHAKGHRRNYRALAAEKAAQQRRKIPRCHRLLDERPELWDHVRLHLRQGKSPEQIAGRLRYDHPDDPLMHISHETIYRAIYILPRGKLREELSSCLRRKRGRKTHDRRGQIPNLVSIHERPREVETREIPGHLEGDLIVGRNHTSALVSLVDRTTRKPTCA